MEIKDILKSIRKANRISQSELAKKIGIGQSTICQWENGTAKPNCDGIVALCKFYMLSADFLLGLSDGVPDTEAMDDEQAECLARFDNLTYDQKRLILELMKQMKDL